MTQGNLPPWGLLPEAAVGNAGGAGDPRIVLPAEVYGMAIFCLYATGNGPTAELLEAAAKPIGETDIGEAFARSIDERCEMLEWLIAAWTQIADHDRRVAELLTANNAEVERRRAAERELALFRAGSGSARLLAHLAGEYGRPLS